MSQRSAGLRAYFSDSYRWLWIAFAVAVLVLPAVGTNYFVGVFTQALIYGLLAISLDIALGYTGLLSLAPAAFFGIGAYSVAKVVVDWGVSYWLGFPLAVVVAAVVAVAIGYGPIKRRIGEVYFVLFTLAFGVLAHDATYVATSLTGGSNGLGYFSPPSMLGVDLGGTVPYYYFTVLVVGALGIGLYALLRSDYGSILHATRQNELRMRYLGYDTDREKLVAWVLSAVTSALAGALFVGTVGLAAPSMMSFQLSGEVIIWTVVGGTGTFVGPFIAAIVLHIVNNYLGNVWPEGYLIVLGVLFVGFVFLLPEGVMGAIRKRLR